LTESNQNNRNKNHFLYSILNPKSICVFGANNNLMSTMGSMQLRNIIAGGFKGPIYPIHLRLEEVQGIKAYKSVLDVPDSPELAFIILPPKVVPKVMEECGQKGVKSLIITSGGFREGGPEGAKLSDQIDEIAKKYGMRFIGPNCLGIYNGWYDPKNEDTHINTMWIYKRTPRGRISIISQSGTIACHLNWYGERMGAKIGQSISVGNERNVDLVDFLEYFRDDPYTNVIGLYIEEIKRGREFIELAKEVSKIKPIVAIYAGGSEAASRSIMSHTGSIAGNSKIYDAVFKETGIISTFKITDFLYYLRAFSTGLLPRGKKVAILTDSGGSGAMLAKSAEYYGLEVPEFSLELQTKIKRLLPPTASAHNPIDLTFDINLYSFYVKFPKLLLKSGEVDAIIIYGVFGFKEFMNIMKNSGMVMGDFEFDVDMMFPVYLKPILRLSKKMKIPVYYIGPQGYSNPWLKKFIENNIPIFDMWDYPTQCLAALVKYEEYRANE